MIPPRTLSVRGKSLSLPTFMPDATYGYVRGLTSADLQELGLTAIMMNAFHLMQKPGSTVISSFGDLHRMSAWPGVIMTDSGGFQAYSLIRQNPKYGSLNENGIIFRPEGSERKLLITPEKSIQLQFSYGSDILICLDDCTHADANYDEQEKSVERTIAWAKRCKVAYEKQLAMRKFPLEQRPLLFAPVQGGRETELRRRCAEALLEIGFDGFGFGGWPLDSESNLLSDTLALLRELIPLQFPIHALGLGHPVSIVAAYDMGYEMFDCALPTRDARHGRLYTRLSADTPLSSSGEFLKFRYINTETNIRDKGPLSVNCKCPCCQHYSVAYLYHLYKMQDASYIRLATQHNLAFMVSLMEELRQCHEHHA